MTIQELLAGLETESNEKLKVVVFNVEDGEIAVYTRSDIDLEEYRGWENLRVAFWGVNGDRVIIHTDIEYGRPLKARRMTCREWAKKHCPALVNERYDGGVHGCPTDYEAFKRVVKLCHDRADGVTRETCTACWSQPVPEGVED